MMDSSRALLILSALLLLLMVVATFSYDTAWSSPQQHPQIETMEIGGARATEDAQHWWLGLGFGVVTIVTLVATLLFAAREGQYAKSLSRAVIAGGFVYAAVFVGMMVSYRQYAAGTPMKLGPFAAPTTWMVFGLWAVPMIFVAIYCVKFNAWFAADSETPSEGDLK
ncbi:MAG: hypothetical protein AAF802_00640 [Planctomycetota bacterium]